MNNKQRLQRIENKLGVSEQETFVALPYGDTPDYDLFPMGNPDSKTRLTETELTAWEQQHKQALLIKVVYQDVIGLHKLS